MSNELWTWLCEQVAEDRRVAQAAMESQRHADDPDGTDAWRASDSDGIYTTDYGAKVLFGPYEYTDPRLAAHVVTWQPKNVLALCEAHERVLTRHRHPTPQDESGSWMRPESCLGCGWSGDPDIEVTYDLDECPELRDMALAYQHRPGYREERP